MSIQTFEGVRRRDLLYVDKTSFVHRLANNGKYYFLA
ncbi:MAG: AAA family ATPase [Bacteroidota bacterium]